MKRRSGLTVVELLVAITIIALLLAIAIPAVQSAREASRRMQCQANQANLGRALHAYESFHHEFPPGTPANGRPPNVWSDRYYGPHVFLLPFLEQGPIAHKIDTGKRQLYSDDPRAIRPAEMAQLATTKINVFLCPSDGSGYGTNYRVCMGPSPYWVKSPLSPGGGTGAFTALEEYTPAQFQDGLSNTVAMSEKLRSDQDASRYSKEDFWYSGLVDLIGYQPPVDEVVRVCASLSGAPTAWHPFTGQTWYLSSYAYTWYNHTVPPNSPIPDCSVQRRMSSHTAPGGGVYKASSYHHGGVNCLLMDGSVRFMNDQIDLAVWRALSTRAGREGIEANAL